MKEIIIKALTYIFMFLFVIFVLTMLACAEKVQNEVRQQFPQIEQSKTVSIEEEKDKLLTNINIVRKNHELPTLEEDDELTKLAGVRMAEIIHDYSHIRPNGDYGYSIIDSKHRGENIAIECVSYKEVLAAWSNSQPYLENLHNENYTKCGISCKQVEDKIYWCMLFSD